MLKVAALARPKRLFYGWVIVAAGCISQTLQSGLGLQGFGTFLVPLEQEFGWSKATLAGARSLAQIESGLIDPIQGAFIDRFGPRIMLGLGMFIFGAGFVFLGFVHALWAYYLAFTVIAVGGSVGGFLVTSVAINNWFRRRRTLALSISQMGLGLGGVLVVPLLVWAQSAHGWRAAAIGAGLAAWALTIPMALMMRHAPERYGLLPDGDSPSRASASGAAGRAAFSGGGMVDFTLKEALRTRAFWLIGLGHGLSVIAVTAAATHQFAHLETERGVGLGRASAALVVTVLSAVNVGGRLIGGVLGDRYDKRYMATLGTAGGAASLVILATAQTLGQAMAFAVLFGLSWGIRGPMMTSLRADYFGRANFGKIAGMSSIVTTPMSIFGPIFAGLLADLQGDYRLGFIILAGISALGCAMFWLARRPPPPDRLRMRPEARPR